MPQNPRVEGEASRAVRANIIQLRSAQGLTQSALAQKAAANGRPSLRHATAIQRIEYGLRHVDVDDLVAIARALGVRPEQLLTPFDCHRCHGEPPKGYACTTCGRAAA